MLRAGLVLLTALLVGCSQPEPDPTFPYFTETGGRVRDMAGILSPAIEIALAAQLDQAEARWGQQLAVVTVGTLHGYDIDKFSFRYANAWGLGDHRRNDGLLLLVAPNERKLRIEVGKGIERTFTNAYCKEVIDMMTPYFRNRDFDGGITAGVAELTRHMQAHPSRPANDNDGANEREKAA